MTELSNLPPVTGDMLARRLEAFQQGIRARESRARIHDNPYPKGSLQKAWQGGWDQANRKAQESKSGRPKSGG